MDNKKPSCSYGGPTVPHTFEGQRPVRLGYDSVIRRTCMVMAGGSKFAFRIAAKPLSRNKVGIDSLAYNL